MKKSSIALFGVLGVMLLLSFFICAMTMTRAIKVLPLLASGEEIEQIIPRFSKITIADEVYPSMVTSGNEQETPSFHFVVTGCDTITAPRLIMDSSWKENLNLAVSDSILRITIDGHTHLADVKHKYEFPVDSSLSRIMELQIPQQMLTSIYGRGFRFDLNGLTNATLAVEFSNINCRDCQFRRLDMQ